MRGCALGPAPTLRLLAALESPRLQSRLAFSFIKQKTYVPPKGSLSIRGRGRGSRRFPGV